MGFVYRFWGVFPEGDADTALEVKLFHGGARLVGENSLTRRGNSRSCHDSPTRRSIQEAGSVVVVGSAEFGGERID